VLDSFGPEAAPCGRGRPARDGRTFDGTVTDRLPAPSIDLDDTPPGRILRTARKILLSENYSGLTMDALAHALGMSKKTLYAHFPSKDAIVRAIIEATGRTIRRQVEAALDRQDDSFATKMTAVFEIVSGHIGSMSPSFMMDLGRYAPQIHGEIDALKERNIPVVFGRVLAIGVAEGKVRDDVEVRFLVEYWLQVIKGIHQPDALARTGLTPRASFEKSLDLFFRGLLTPAGRDEFLARHAAHADDPEGDRR